MPNLGTVNNQSFKCSECRKSFGSTWLPDNVCCRIALAEQVQKQAQESEMNLYQRHLKPKTGFKFGRNITLNDQGFGFDQNAAPPTPKHYNKVTNVGSFAPFTTLQKPTCGYFFSFETDHRKLKIGIPPNDMVRWRSHKK